MIETVELSVLVPHHLQEATFDSPEKSGGWEALLQSIRENGVIQIPIVADNGDGVTMEILSGHRRLAALEALGHESTECSVVTRGADQTEEEWAEYTASLWRELNLHREMSASEKAKWLATFPVASKGTREERSQTAKRRKQAAADVDVTDRTARHARKATDAIASLRAEGREEEADRIERVMDDRGFRPAAELAAEIISEPVPVYDATGKPVADNVRDVFASKRHQNVLTMLTRLKQETIGTGGSTDGSLAGTAEGCCLPVQDIGMAIENIRSVVQKSRPYTECPRCKRVLKTGCAMCNGRGWINASAAQTLTKADLAWLDGREDD